jgi:hypothetical protein
MMVRWKHAFDRQCIGHLLLRLTLGLPLIYLAVLPVHAQEVVDPRSGRLSLTTTDLIVPTRDLPGGMESRRRMS